MKKSIKYTLLGLGGLAALAIVGAVVFALTFDPNRYKAQIEGIAKERTGRTLKLQGDLEVAFFPSLGAKVAGVTLSERASESEFLSLESAHASVALLPLLRGALIVDGVRVAGLKAQIVKGKDGRYNFEDLIGTAGAKPPAKPGEPKAEPPGDAQAVKFDIAGVHVERSSVSYRDLATGQELALSELKLSTGRIAERAEGKLDFSVHAKRANPALDARLELAAGYRVNLAESSYALSKLDAKLKGVLGKDSLEAKVAAPQVFVSKDQAKGDEVTVEFKLKGERSIEAALKLSGVEGSAKALVVPALSADIALSGPDLPQKSLRIAVSGSLRADLEKQTASADLAAKFDESNIQAKLGLAKFTPASYVFDLNVDRLNLDKYFPPKREPAKPAAPASPEKPAAAKTDTPVDLGVLKDLNANGRMQFGALQINGLKLANLRAEVRAASGRLDVAPHSANLYEGSISGALTLHAEGNRIALKESLSNVSVGPLLRDFAEQDRLEGRGNLALDVVGAGKTVEAMKQALAGTARLQLRDGAIKGVNITEVLRKARSALGSESARAASTTEKTDFSELSASFTIKNGVAHNEDLDVKAPLFRLSGRGDIDIGNSRLDYVTKASVVATTKGQGGAELAQLSGVTVPVRLTGPFDDLKYQVDYAAAAAGLVKSRVGDKVKERVEERKDKVEERLGSRLKGLFGR